MVWQVQDDIVYAAAGNLQLERDLKNINGMKITLKRQLFRSHFRMQDSVKWHVLSAY